MRLTKKQIPPNMGFYYLDEMIKKLSKLEDIEEKYDLDLLDFLTNNSVIVNELENYKTQKEQSNNYKKDLELILEQKGN